MGAWRQRPRGHPGQRQIDVLEGRWDELRAAVIEGNSLARRWQEGARWYRRASRALPVRATVGMVVAVILDRLRAADSLLDLRQRYCERDGEWAHGVAARWGLSDKHQADLRRIEDAAHGLRRLELAHGLRLDLHRSLVPQLPLALLDEAAGPLSGRPRNPARRCASSSTGSP